MLLKSLLLLFIVHSSLVFGWGPFSHQNFACQIAHNNTQEFTGDCPAGDVNTAAFMLGGSSPDAFKQFSPMHSLLYATVQLSYAIDGQDDTMIDFARGYGSHLVADAIGHHGDGYLTPSHDHEIEFAADTFNVKNSTAYTFQQFHDDEVAFVANAAQHYQSFDPKFTPPTADSLNSAVSSFKSTTDKEALVIAVNVGYKEEMVLWDNHNASDFAEAYGYYEAARSCIMDGVEYWIGLVEGGKTAPATVVSETTAMINDAFQAGKCK